MVRKVAFGCGSFPIDGWESHDLDVDLTKRLPYDDGSIDFIFSEHVLEHLLQRDAWNYLEECLRILRRGGVVRTTVPSVIKVEKTDSIPYRIYLKDHGIGDGSKKSSIRHVLFYNGHQSIWTGESLSVVLRAIGFKAREVDLYCSEHPELQNVEQHWKSVGRDVNDAESVAVEAIK